MTWKSFHRRGAILRDVIAHADQRRDGALPMQLPGVAETFDDELALLGALQLRWHTRLAGRIDRALMAEPLDLEDAVVRSWREAAEQMPGVRAIIDAQRATPASPEIAAAMAKSAAKEHTMLALLAGRASAPGPAAERAGADIERKARAMHVVPAA